MKNKKKIVSKLLDIADYLQEAGFLDDAEEINVLVDAVSDGAVEDLSFIDSPTDPYGSPGGGSPSFAPDVGERTSSFVATLVSIANELDERGCFDEADAIDHILSTINRLEKRLSKRKKKQDKKQTEEVAARNNGQVGTGVTDNQNCGMFQGFSDAYFFQGYGNLEAPYK